MLVEQRKQWREDFKHTKPSWPALEDYRKHRDSDSWRSTAWLEHMCEYIIFLEEREHAIKENFGEAFDEIFQAYNTPGDKFVDDTSWCQFVRNRVGKAFTALQNINRIIR